MLKSGIWVKHIKCHDECHTTHENGSKGDKLGVKIEETAKFELL